MDILIQDVKYALRSLRRTPGFALTVIAVMALGIGVNSLIYTVVRGIMFADLPFPNVERMVRVEAFESGFYNSMSLLDLKDVRERVQSLTATSALYEWSAFVAAGDEPQRYQAIAASPSLPEALGTRPALGRWFTQDECRVGAPSWGSVVLSDKLWREAFHADPHILGTTLRVNGRVRTVVGVMPVGFRYPEQSDVFSPLPMNDSTETRGSHYLKAVARLAPGRTLKQARAEMAVLSKQLARDFKETNGEVTLVPRDFRDALLEDVRPQMIMLTLAVTFVLLIASANVANLLLARATARQREMGVRIALGAGRGRLVRQMLTESLILSLTGGVIGVLLGDWGMRITLASIPVELPYWMKFQLDPTVLVAVLGVSILAGIAFGLAPALQTTAGDVLAPLREGSSGAGDSRSRHRFRSALVVSEIALAVVLLIGSGLMIRSFLQQMNQRLTLRTQGVLTGSLTLPVALYPNDSLQVAFFREFRERLGTLPGVQAAGGVLVMHLGDDMWTRSIQREGVESGKSSEKDPAVAFNTVTPGYFDAVGMRILKGRDFSDADRAWSPSVAIVSDVAARRLWPNQDPIGKRWRFGPDAKRGWFTVVGVVTSVRQNVRARESSLGEMIVPNTQFTRQTMSWAIRSTAPTATITAAVRRMLRERDPNLVFAEVRTLDEHARRFVWEWRVYAQLMGAFSLVALIIAALGIYGVMAYTVAQRTREIGIRMALGAARADVQRLVVGQALRLTLIGAGVGLAAAFALTQLMKSMLFGIRPDDPPTFVGVTLILALSSAAAAWLPTARALRVDPVVALRHE
ncbi:MAG TPA: ABC transporter permease [Methylomirabilota bacterium]|jgi:predicted permease|nr:ABC transporter permease [Methylomirabilota bacterium]